MLNQAVGSLTDVQLNVWQVHGTNANPHNYGGMPLGVHMDTAGASRRFLTALVYLTTVATGGGTVFPLAQRALGLDYVQSNEEEGDYVAVCIFFL